MKPMTMRWLAALTALVLTIVVLEEKASQGAMVVQVGPNTPAGRAGFQLDDVIGATDRQPVLNTADLIRIIGGYHPGATVEILVIRQGNPQTLRVPLAGQGQAEATRPAPPVHPFLPAGDRATSPAAGLYLSRQG